MNGKEFKAWRLASGFTMQAVSDKTGVWKSRISRFENGNSLNQANYQKLLSFVNGELPEDKQAKIRWHIAQIALLNED